jgi:hypothetical protein
MVREGRAARGWPFRVPGREAHYVHDRPLSSGRSPRGLTGAGEEIAAAGRRFSGGRPVYVCERVGLDVLHAGFEGSFHGTEREIQ